MRNSNREIVVRAENRSSIACAHIKGNDGSAVIVVVVNRDVEGIGRQKSVSSDKIDSYNLEKSNTKAQIASHSIFGAINSIVHQLRVKTDFAKCTSAPSDIGTMSECEATVYK